MIQPIQNSVRNAVGPKMPNGMSTAPTMTARRYSICVTISATATRGNATTMAAAAMSSSMICGMFNKPSHPVMRVAAACSGSAI